MAEKHQEEKQFKLNYKIVGKDTQQSTDDQGRSISMDVVHVEWTHAGGPVPDYCQLPCSHPPIHPAMEPIKYQKVKTGERGVIHDQVSVKHGTPNSVVMQILEEKRERLAANLGVEP